MAMPQWLLCITRINEPCPTVRVSPGRLDDSVPPRTAITYDRGLTPRRSMPAATSEEAPVGLSIGIVGLPNVGKSTLFNALTRNEVPLHPQIGVCEDTGDPNEPRRLQIADIPGLIAGASEDRGLGHRFLRHIERCRLLVLLLDMAGSDGRDPRDDHATLVRELGLYDPALLKKPQLVVANKMDLPGAAALLARFRRRHRPKIFAVSCVTGAGLEELKKELSKRVLKLRAREKKSPLPAG